MATILFCNIPEPNHAFPMMPFVQEFRKRGHRVIFSTGQQGVTVSEDTFETVVGRISGSGTVLSPYQEEFDTLYEQILQRATSTIEGYHSILRQESPDFVMVGSLDVGAAIASEQLRVRWAVMGINPGMLEPEGGAPYTGRGIDSTGLKTRVIRYFHHQALKKWDNAVNELRNAHGLSSLRGAFTRQMLQGGQYLALGIPSMEIGSPRFPDQVEFVGPVVWGPERTTQKPDWFGRLPAPVVVVLLRYVPAPDNHILVKRLIDGLGDENCSVLIECGDENLGLENYPDNFRVVEHLTFSSLLPDVHLLVHRGNYFAYAAGIREGIPAMIVPTGAEGRENAARARYAGIAEVMDLDQFRPERLRKAMSRLLREPLTRMLAERLRHSLEGYHSIAEVARAVEQKAKEEGSKTNEE